MSMFVNTNVSALNAQRQLFDVSNALSTSFERLSSGDVCLSAVCSNCNVEAMCYRRYPPEAAP